MAAGPRSGAATTRADAPSAARRIRKPAERRAPLRGVRPLELLCEDGAAKGLLAAAAVEGHEHDSEEGTEPPKEGPVHLADGDAAPQVGGGCCDGDGPAEERKDQQDGEAPARRPQVGGRRRAPGPHGGEELVEAGEVVPVE